MRTALILSGVVDSISLCDPAPIGWEMIPDAVHAGYVKHEDGSFSPPAPTPKGRDEIYRPLLPYQFAAVIDLHGLSDKIRETIDALPRLPRAVFQAKLTRMSAYHRDDPTMELLLDTMGIDAATADSMWLEGMGL